MSQRALNMEMANLICRFGSNYKLLDLLEEIVLPAFFTKNNNRKHGKTKYFFNDVSLVLLDDDNEKVVGIVGRFIKDTNLEREQVFDEQQGLIKDEHSIRSSPSAIFLLVLNNHRLIYVKETRYAPSKDSFKATLLNFLRLSRKKLIDKSYENNKSLRENNPKLEKVTKKELMEKYPKPTLEIVSLTSEESIEEFIRKYSILKTIEIVFLARNDEVDNESFFKQFQQQQDKIGSVTSTLKHSSSKGLDKEVAIEEVSQATIQGNQEVKLSGIDENGDQLRGNNEEFQLKTPLDNLSETMPEAAKDLYETFSDLVAAGLISIPKTNKKALNIIDKLAKELL